MEYLPYAMTNYFSPLEPGTFYHMYNRGNNGDCIFYTEENYRYFLRKLDNYLSAYLDVFAYALLPNHFHFLVKTKTAGELLADKLAVQSGRKTLVGFSEIMSEELRRFFLSYAKSIKVQEERTGSLFEKNVKRIPVNSPGHLLWLFNYIHRNPEIHGFVRDFRTYRFSSYASLLSTALTKLKREDVMALFGSREEFVRFHLTNPVIKEQDILAME